MLARFMIMYDALKTDLGRNIADETKQNGAVTHGIAGVDSKDLLKYCCDNDESK